ncbi:MAG TPA: hypothetical protein VHN99_01145 [Deinococcales bacterium]|nr:hypothetical protein [Deinococcales bacterium]
MSVPLTTAQKLHVRLQSLGVSDPQERRAFICWIIAERPVASLNDLPQAALDDAWAWFEERDNDRLQEAVDEFQADVDAQEPAPVDAGAAAFDALPAVTETDLTKEDLAGTLFDRKAQRQAATPGLPAAQRARIIRETAQATARHFKRDQQDGSGVDWIGNFSAALDQLDDAALLVKAAAFGVEVP